MRLTPEATEKRRLHRRAGLTLGCLLTVGVTVLLAHEGHAPLPTKGVQVDLARGHVLLTPAARDGLAVSTAEAEERAVEERFLAYATVEVAWPNHGFATARLPGRIVKVHVAPGQAVRAGDVVAEVRSLDLDTLQLDALTAQTELGLGERLVRVIRASVDSGAIAEQVLFDAEVRLAQAKNALRVPGVVDLQVEPQVEISQVRLRVKRDEAARYGLAPGDVARLLETAYKGRSVSTVLDGEKSFSLVVWYDAESRSDPGVIGQTILDTPSGRKVALSQVADVLDTTGPNTLNHENVERRIVVSCNVQGRSLGDVVGDIRAAVRPVEEKLHKKGGEYRVEEDGQFRAQQEANARLLALGGAAVLGVFLLLCRCLGSWRAALMVLGVNVPLAGLGAVLALLLLNRPDPAALAGLQWWQVPRVWFQATTLSVAHWVGFITLIGIVSRNGIMMIAHYIHLMKEEGEQFGEKMIIRGSLERLAPVLMTAAVVVIGLIPLALGKGQTGKEILHPLAVVVIGGLVTSTLLDQVVTPAVFLLFGRNVFRPESTGREVPAWDDAWYANEQNAPKPGSESADHSTEAAPSVVPPQAQESTNTPPRDGEATPREAAPVSEQTKPPAVTNGPAGKPTTAGSRNPSS